VNEREIPENDREKEQTEWGERVGKLRVEKEGRSRVTIAHIQSVSQFVLDCAVV